MVGGSSGTTNGRDLGFASPRRARPSDVYSLDVATGKLERWTESETGGLERRKLLASPSSSAGRASTAATISGFLYQPAGRSSPGKRPVIINIHGGPEGQSRPASWAATTIFSTSWASP